MYQLGTKWKLWDLPNFLQADIEAITLRGYSTEPDEVVDTLRLPADLYTTRVDSRGNFRGLSVAAITSRECPTQRDLYLENTLDLRGRKGQGTWGRVAGNLIEEYCKGLLEHFSQLAQRPDGLDYQKIHSLTGEYSQIFWRTHANGLRKLQEKAGSFLEEPKRLAFLLQQTAKYELTMLGVDYALSQNGNGEFVPLMQGILIVFDEAHTRIQPATSLGLSKTTTPDFIILEPTNVVMGDVKAGDHFKSSYLDTIAGYALAYESQHKQNVNFGVVYFFETHARQMSFAQSYVFVIDDFLRQSFLYQRNNAYRILQQDTPPQRTDDYETSCKYCKHLAHCYPDSND
jgi:CRISPR/Cas system-associated exonuclease Cas4 (RecB family)